MVHFALRKTCSGVLVKVGRNADCNAVHWMKGLGDGRVAVRFLEAYDGGA